MPRGSAWCQHLADSHASRDSWSKLTHSNLNRRDCVVERELHNATGSRAASESYRHPGDAAPNNRDHDARPGGFRWVTFGFQETTGNKKAAKTKREIISYHSGMAEELLVGRHGEQILLEDSLFLGNEKQGKFEAKQEESNRTRKTTFMVLVDTLRDEFGLKLLLLSNQNQL